MRARLTLAVLALAAMPLVAQQAPAAAPDSADIYTVVGYWGRMWREDGYVELLGLEVMQVRPGALGARFQVGAWRESIADGSLLVETEAGPVAALPVTRGLMLAPSGGFMFAIGDGVIWGFHANAGLIVGLPGRLTGRVSYGRHWYRLDGEYIGLNTATVGLGWRLGPYPPSVAAPR